MDMIVGPDGIVRFGGTRYPGVIGRSGISSAKREGDGATPAGEFPLRAVWYRPDRLARPRTSLPVSEIGPEDGWCDDPASPDYNRPVRLPIVRSARVDARHAASCERLWRDDGLYDVLIVAGYNDDPVVAGAGSAIFVHVAAPGGGPTEGCVALEKPDLLHVLRRLGPESRLIVEPG